MTKATTGKNKTKLDIKCSGRLRKNIKSGFTIFESSLIPSASLPTKPRKFEKPCIEQVLFLSSVSTLTWRTTWTNSFFLPWPCDTWVQVWRNRALGSFGSKIKELFWASFNQQLLQQRRSSRVLEKCFFTDLYLNLGHICHKLGKVNKYIKQITLI